MTREEILNEIDEAMTELRAVKTKVNDTLAHARNIVSEKDNLEAYNKGMNDAWELATKLYVDTAVVEIKKIYDIEDCEFFPLEQVFKNLTPQEALAKLEAYEKEQAEIKVGDIVKSGENYFLVTKTYNNTFEGMSDKGCLSCGLSLRVYKKTGKHIDLTDVFKQIGGAE